jgi:hypothetical protein
MMCSHRIKIACSRFTSGGVDTNTSLRMGDFRLQWRRDVLPVRQIWARDLSGVNGSWWKNLRALTAACLGNPKARAIFVAKRLDTTHERGDSAC